MYQVPVAEMDQDEDEDVVFQGSPLYNHLLDAGVSSSDVPSEPKHSSNAVTMGSVAQYQSMIQNWNGVHGCVSGKVFSHITRLWKHIKSKPFDCSFLDMHFDRVIVQKLCMCSSLQEEDSQFLETYVEPRSSDIVGSVLALERISLPKSAFILALALPFVCAYCYYRVVYPELPWPYRTYTDISSIVTIIYILFFGVYQLYVLFARKKREKRIYLIDRFLEIDASLLTMFRKSIRLVQETELVARGFTLVSQQSPMSRMELGHPWKTSCRQCPDLRKLVFLTSRTAMMKFREATQKLLEICPVSVEFDSISHYLAYIPLSEYGPCMQICGEKDTADTELYTATDGYSIAALKGMNQLFCLQQSEFIRRLVLCFYFHARRKNAMSPAVYSQLENVVDSLVCILEEQFSSVVRSYNFHSCSILNNEPVKTSSKKIKECSPFTDLHVAVHSLDLHLQAALSRVRALSTWLEKLMEENKALNEPISQDSLINFLKPIRAELVSCRGCWEDGISHIDRLEKRGDGDRKESKTIASHPTNTEPLLTPTVLADCWDPIIEDQVFEAYTDPDELDTADYSWDNFLTEEEKAKKKREKEEALRLLTELKSVISVRAVAREQRELEVLLKSQHKPKYDAKIKCEKNSKKCDLERKLSELPLIPDLGSEIKNSNFEVESEPANGITNCKELSHLESRHFAESVEAESISSSRENHLSNPDSSKMLYDINPRENVRGVAFIDSESRGEEDQTTNKSVTDSTEETVSNDEAYQHESSRQMTMGLACKDILSKDMPTSTKKIMQNECITQVNRELEGHDRYSHEGQISKDIEPKNDLNLDGEQFGHQSQTKSQENMHQPKVFEHDPLLRSTLDDTSESLNSIENNLQSGQIDDMDGDENISDRKKRLEERLTRLSGANLALTSSLASLAAAKSQSLGLSVDTFKDSSDSEEEGLVED
ncbi:hypothetical protein ACJMK2_016007 [Sinanodonta woodiana]|uniref:Vezatin n=1 Tax=Sinanodonta woodiana TaxID=1069815 RepID=A0ABD3UVW3_SINWO